MALFTRKDGRAGDAPITTLATSPDTVQDTTTGYKLTESDLTSLSGMLSTSYDQAFVALHASRQRQSSKRLQGKQVVFTFSCGDPTGVEQQIIKSFFTYDRPIQYVDSQRDIQDCELYVTAIDDSFYSGADSVQVTATMVDSDVMDKSSVEIKKGTVAAAGSGTLSASYTNDAPTAATIMVELGANTPMSWSGVSFTITATTADSKLGTGKIVAVVGNVTSSGIRFDSLDEFTYGYGTISNVGDAKYFSIPAGLTADVSVTVNNTAAHDISVKLIAVAQAPKGQYAF